MPDPVYQTLWRRIIYVLAGFTGLSELLHSVSGATEIVTPVVTYIGSAILATILIALLLVLPLLRPKWTVSGGRTVYLKGLGIQPVWFIVGAGVLLWTPRIAEFLGKTKELDRPHYDELASQWEEVMADPVERISIGVTFPKTLVRAKDFLALLAGLKVTFDDDERQGDDLLRLLEFRPGDSADDYQKSLTFQVTDHAGHSYTETPELQIWRQFEGADTWLCWWSSKFAWRNGNDSACCLDVTATIPPGHTPLSLRTLFSFSNISIRAPYGLAVHFSGPRELPDPVMEITVSTRYGWFRIPLESFDSATEIDDNTKVKTILVSIAGHDLRRTMRDQFFKKREEPSQRQEKPGHEVHAVTGTIDYLMGFFPRNPTSMEWDRMRHIHPELVPKGH